MFITGLGQDSHRFEEKKSKPLIMGGIEVDYPRSLKGNSDADPVLHAITNAISSVTGVNILGKIADDLCKQGITDSKFYLLEAMKYLKDTEILHVAISIECLEPKLANYIAPMKKNIAGLLNISENAVGITATTGEGMNGFGRGEGIQAFAVVSFAKSIL
ncbi:MAG: 2-C-methyl-D-erythritol 2,4-cyclodiphosphate synthase [Ignavibacteria bacterium]|nr:MAG: 2-C-methyl-D-erythritol 2,4-cyclodiphosphate synthase [Ignavibacteria bacterium]